MLRQRYEQLRQRALEQTGTGIASDVVMRGGMRSWLEAWREEIAPAAPTPLAGRRPADPDVRQMAAVWASVFVGRAERR